MKTEVQNSKQRIVLAGGSGFLGSILARYFAQREWEVFVLTREAGKRGGHEKAQEGTKIEVFWDGRTLGAWTEVLEGARAVVNLAGKSVNCRYNARNRKEILESRLNPTAILGQAVSRCSNPPKAWLNAATATIYKHAIEQAMDESCTDFSSTPAAKDAFSVHVSREWERAFENAATPGTRKVALRISMVLGIEEGTVFRVLRGLVTSGLGGKMGSGKQYVSWIHEADFCRAVDWILNRPEFSGPVNIVAPAPVPNREMMKIFREVEGRRFGLPATEWMLEFGAFFMRTETELMLKSRRVIPARLLASGFQFQFSQLRPALEDLEKRLEDKRSKNQ